MSKKKNVVMDDGGMWFEVVGLFKEEDKEPKDIEGHNVYIRGEVDNMIIIQVPKGVHHQTILAGIQRILDKEKIEKGVFVIDQDINFMKLEPVEKNKSFVMEAKYQEIKMNRQANVIPITKTRQ